jgi:hypothetical protein
VGTAAEIRQSTPASHVRLTYTLLPGQSVSHVMRDS